MFVFVVCFHGDHVSGFFIRQFSGIKRAGASVFSRKRSRRTGHITLPAGQLAMMEHPQSGHPNRSRSTGFQRRIKEDGTAAHEPGKVTTAFLQRAGRDLSRLPGRDSPASISTASQDRTTVTRTGTRSEGERTVACTAPTRCARNFRIIALISGLFGDG